MSKSESSPRLLKNLLIYPRFQLKFMSYFIALFLLTTTCLYSTTFLFFWKFKQKAIKVGIPDGHIFFQFLDKQKGELDLLFIGLALVNFILLLGTALIISHRIAGPIHKLKMGLASLSKDSEDFKLRENDFFQELGPLINKLKDKSDD